MFKNQTVIEIVSGLASGADTLGIKYAIEKGYPVMKFPANLRKYGKKAGYIRNKQMAEYAVALILFWNGKSKGLSIMLELAVKNNLISKVVYI